MDDQDPGERPGAGGEGLVGVDLGALVAGERDVPGAEGLFGCGHGGLLLSSLRVAWRSLWCDRARRPHYGPSPVPPGVATGMMCAVRRLSVALAGLVSLAAVVAAGSPAGGAVAAGGSAVAVRTVRGARRSGHARRPRARCGRGPLRRRHRALPRARRARHLRDPATACACSAGHAATLAGGSCAGAGSIGHPSGVAVDAQGDVYIAEATAQRVQVVRPAGRAVVTVAGTGGAGFNGDGLAGTASELDEPTGVAVDGSGDLVIADTANCRVRVLAAGSATLFGQAMTAGHLYTVAGTGVCGIGRPGRPRGGGAALEPGGRGRRRRGRPVRGRQRRPVRAARSRRTAGPSTAPRSAPATSASSWAGRAGYQPYLADGAPRGGRGGGAQRSPRPRPRPDRRARSSPTASCRSSGWCRRPPARCSGGR